MIIVKSFIPEHNPALTPRTVDTDNVYAVLHYAGAPNAEPATQADVGVSNLLQEYQLAALENPGAPGGSAPADRSIDLNFSEQVTNGRLQVGHGHCDNWDHHLLL